MDLASFFQSLLQPKLVSPIPDKQNLSTDTGRLHYIFNKNQADALKKFEEGKKRRQAQLTPKQVLGVSVSRKAPERKLETMVGNAVIPQTPKEYQDIIVRSAQEQGIPPRLLSALLYQESGYNPEVISGRRGSSAGARGIAQFMPQTAQGIGIDPLDPNQAIPAAARYIAAKKKQHGSLDLALAAYNSGSGNVQKYGGIPPFPETQRYVRNILQLAGELK